MFEMLLEILLEILLCLFVQRGKGEMQIVSGNPCPICRLYLASGYKLDYKVNQTTCLNLCTKKSSKT